MTTPKFTPGPWEVHQHGQIISTHDIALSGAVALVGLIYDKADQSLVSSAPDLYTALEACEEQLEQMASMYPEGEWTAVLTQTRTALAKARGMKGGE